MKKFIFLLSLLFMASMSNVNAQLFVHQDQATLLKVEPAAEHIVPKADYVIKYIAANPAGALGNDYTGTRYISGCIDFTAAQMYNYIGGTLYQISVAIPASTSVVGMTQYKIWIKKALDGPVVYEQIVTPTLTATGHYEDYTLTTPYPITAGPLVIGFTSTHVNSGTTTVSMRPLYCSTTGDTYKPGGFNYILGTTATQHEVGATWNKYTTAGNLAIEGYLTGVSTLPSNDLTASTIAAEALKWVGTQSTFAVTVYNTGTASQNSYSVQLIDAANNVLATQAVTTALAAGTSTTINVNYTPTAAGIVAVRGKVVLSGDQVAGNDLTEPLSCKIYPMQPMAYCTTIAQGFLTAATPPATLNVAIGYPTANIGPFVGKKVSGIDVYIDAPPSLISNATVWVRSALTGTNITTQTFTPVQGWNYVTLTTPFNITNADTYIGASYDVNASGAYPMATSANTQNAANGGHYLIGATGTWTTLASNYPIATYPNAANWAIVGVVEQGTPASCNPPTALNVAYTADCKANLTWTAPGKGKAVQNFTYTGAAQPVTLQPGTYEIEVWGADGGPARAGVAGKGGYSKGTITVTSPTTYYVYVGGKGNTAPGTAAGGWNGGGPATGSYSSGYDGGTGGGGTDIRTTQNTTYDDRIIVGGGGGGANGYGVSYIGNGGNGGGLTGADGTTTRTPNPENYTGKGGTQTAGGAASNLTYCTAGSKGVGGDFHQTLGGSAGGGGWYGGGGGYWGGAGGAGSGYIGGVTGGVTIRFDEPNFVSCPDASGNGYARITDGGTTPGGFAYNVYRDGNPTPIASNVTTTSYTDATLNASVGHTWDVKTVCDAGVESSAVSKTMPACDVPGDCNPPTNLNVAYATNCGSAQLTWTAPGKGKGDTFLTDDEIVAKQSEQKLTRRALSGETGPRLHPASKANNGKLASPPERSERLNKIEFTDPKGATTTAYMVDVYWYGYYGPYADPMKAPLNNPANSSYC